MSRETTGKVNNERRGFFGGVARLIVLVAGAPTTMAGLLSGCDSEPMEGGDGESVLDVLIRRGLRIEWGAELKDGAMRPYVRNVRRQDEAYPELEESEHWVVTVNGQIYEHPWETPGILRDGDLVEVGTIHWDPLLSAKA